jgi:MATE family multidrug resistance protein
MSSAGGAAQTDLRPPGRGPVAREVEIRLALRRLLTLAGPVVLAELGWMAMGLVDTVMVGPLGPEAIGSVGVGGNVFMALVIFGMGLLLGLDTLVSQAHGAGRLDECHRWLVHGVVLGVAVAVPLTGLILLALRGLQHAGLHPDVMRLTVPYVEVVTWSVVPLLLYAAFRRYLQGVASVRPITVALLSANAVNAGANWVLIYGHLGMPALGVTGAAWATVISRIYMASVLLVAIHLHDRRTGRRLPAALDGVSWLRLTRLFRLGFPAAMQVTLEVGVFAAATALAGRLPPVSLASHQIALNIAAFVFMVPLGMASASAVVVGHAVGRGDPRGAAVAGWTALGLSSSPRPARCSGCSRPTSRCSPSAPGCCSSRRSSNCSTACRSWRRASCAGSATRGRPCSGTSRGTGASACRWVTRSVSIWAGG